MMIKLASTLASGAALAATALGCAEQEAPEPTPSLDRPVASTVLLPAGGEQPLPPDLVFFPDAYAEDGRLFFRVQMLPGYYIYKDKFSLRSLSDEVEIDDDPIVDAWSRSEIIADEWFGEQEVFFTEASGATRMQQVTPDVRTADIELSYQGCKKDGICYLPQSKVLSVEIPTQLESAADPTE